MVGDKKSAFTPSAFLKAFENDPLAAIIITDIDADLGDAEDSIALITALASEVKVRSVCERPLKVA